MMRVAVVLSSLVLAALGGCIGTPGPVAYRTDPGPGVRTVRVPATLTGADGQGSSLILGVQ